MENITPQEQYEILEMSKISGFTDRQKGKAFFMLQGCSLLCSDIYSIIIF